MVHEDASASELLRAQDVENVLQKAYSDSTIAVLTDPLPESQGQHSFHTSNLTSENDHLHTNLNVNGV